MVLCRSEVSSIYTSSTSRRQKSVFRRQWSSAADEFQPEVALSSERKLGTCPRLWTVEERRTVVRFLQKASASGDGMLKISHQRWTPSRVVSWVSERRGL